MDVVWRYYPAGAGELTLALALADWANDEGRSIYPSVPAAARKARLSERQVQRLLRKMEGRGYLEVDGETEYGTRRYRLRLDLIETLPIVCGRGYVTPGDKMSPGDNGDKNNTPDVTTTVTSGAETLRSMSPKPFTTTVYPSTPPTDGGGVDEKVHALPWPHGVDASERALCTQLLAEYPHDLQLQFLRALTDAMSAGRLRKKPHRYLAGCIKKHRTGDFTFESLPARQETDEECSTRLQREKRDALAREAAAHDLASRTLAQQGRHAEAKHAAGAAQKARRQLEAVLANHG